MEFSLIMLSIGMVYLAIRLVILEHNFRTFRQDVYHSVNIKEYPYIKGHSS